MAEKKSNPLLSELRRLLRQPNMRQVRQRIAVAFHLQPLTEVETSHYMSHRLELCGGTLGVFDAGSASLIHIHSGGIPRLINVICDAALVYAFAEHRETVSLDIVRQGMSRPHCFVFSDDPRWARENLQTDIPTTFVDVHASDRAHEDLRLMRACKRFVIANSSFSWWGAWLGQSADKVVVAPRRWFKDEKMDTSDLIPDDWIQV